MMQEMQCPFFREPCLRENCTAFWKKDRLEYGVDIDLNEPTMITQLRVPYCTALNNFLPMSKELE